MPSTIAVAAGGFRFAPGVFQYPAGVAAEPGFRIERARFAEPVPLAEGFTRVAAALDAARRPKAAFRAFFTVPDADAAPPTVVAGSG